MNRNLNIGNVVKETADKLRGRRDFVRRTFQPPVENMHLLSPQEQLDTFLRLTPADLQALRNQRGDKDVREYVRAQVTNYMRQNR